MDALSGKKTYIAVILAAVSAVCLYAQGVVVNGFDLNELFKFINTEAMVAAFATLRLAIAKKA